LGFMAPCPAARHISGVVECPTPPPPHPATPLCPTRVTQLTRYRAEEFYAEHEGKPFFPNLVAFITSGPVYALVLAKPSAIADWRKLMGPTNVLKARVEAPRRWA